MEAVKFLCQRVLVVQNLIDSTALPCQREVPSVSEAEGFLPGCGGTACRARPVRIPPAAFGVHLSLTREAFLREG